MTISRGQDFVLYVGGTPAAYGNERDTTINLTTESIDTTNKSNTNFKSSIISWVSWSLDSGNVLDATDTGYLAIETAVLNRTTIAVEWRDTDNNTEYVGTGIVTSFSNASPYGDAGANSITIEGTGSLVKSTSTGWGS